VHRRVAFGLFLVAVGCGSFEASENEPIPAPSPSTSPPAEQAPQSSDSAPSQASGSSPSAGAGTSTPATPGCKVGFQKDVLPKLAASCGQTSCHADQMNRPFIAASAAKMTHEELMEFEFGSIEWSDPHSEYSGANEPDLKKALDAWRLCGAKLD
jgi:hypothetical protein